MHKMLNDLKGGMEKNDQGIRNYQKFRHMFIKTQIEFLEMKKYNL